MKQAAQIFPTDYFEYQYLAGPVDTPAEFDQTDKGNCRYALQLYFYRIHGTFYERDEIYLPGGYKMLGKFIFKEEEVDSEKLETGDVIYAQTLRNKDGKEVDKSLARYRNKDEWLYYLHSVIYIGQISPHSPEYIWHATHIEGGPALWPWEKFLHYYKPVTAKRVLE